METNKMAASSQAISSSVKKFVFTTAAAAHGEQHPEPDQLIITIPEELKADYGMYIWPCAPVLAQFIWHNRHLFNNSNVLELGAGTALPGIVAAKCGAKVTLSDCSRLTNCLQNCHRSCMANDLHHVNVIGITWGCFTPQLAAIKNLDFILASDCFYDRSDFNDILATISFIFESNPKAQFLSTYQVRSSNWEIGDLLKDWGLKCIQIPLWTFNADTPNIAETSLPGRHSIQMLKITKLQ